MHLKLMLLSLHLLSWAFPVGKQSKLCWNALLSPNPSPAPSIPLEQGQAQGDPAPLEHFEAMASNEANGKIGGLVETLIARAPPGASGSAGLEWALRTDSSNKLMSMQPFRTSELNQVLDLDKPG